MAVLPPQRVIVTQRAGRVKRLGKGAGIFKFLWRHKIFIITFLFLLPSIITTIDLTIKEKNPLIPFLVVGGHLFNSDNNLAFYTAQLEEDPSSLFVLKDDDVGFFGKVKFFLNRLFLFYLILSAFWFLYINWKIYTWLVAHSPFSNTSNVWVNASIGFLILLIVMILTNFVVLTIGLIEGTVQIELEGAELFFQKATIIFLKVVPFRGVIAFVMFLPTLFAKMSDIIPSGFMKNLIER